MFQYQVESVPAEVAQLMKRYEHFVIVGLGGSVLPLKVFVKALGLEKRISFLDSLEPGQLEECLRIPSVLFCVVSKSGETIEIHALLQELLAAHRQKDLLIVTDAQSGRLRALAKENGWASLTIPREIGGRFTHFTVLHRALLERLGLSFDAVLSAAAEEREALKKNPLILEQLYQTLFFPGKTKVVLWCYGERWLGLADWLQQALAESLGKMTKEGKRVGSFPIVLKGPQDQHSVLQLLMEGPQDFCIWFFDEEVEAVNLNRRESPFPDLASLSLDRLRSLFCEAIFESFRERQTDPSTATALMLIRSRLDLKDVGQLIARFQALIEYAGDRLGINAFDQPGVERGKQLMRQKLKSD